MHPPFPLQITKNEKEIKDSERAIIKSLYRHPNVILYRDQRHLYPIGSINNRPQAHASQIQVGPIINNKQLLFVVWFAGLHEGHEDVAILFTTVSYALPEKDLTSFTFDEFCKVSETIKIDTPSVIADRQGEALGNPVIFFDENKTLHLWFASFPPKRGDQRTIFYKYSRDLGKTWSKEREFSDRKGLWVRNPLLPLKDGTWILPLNDEETFNPKHKTKWASRFAYSYDKGKTWFFGENITIKRGMIQPTLIEYPDGKIYCMNRTRSKFIAEMWSYNGGRTWTTPTLTRIPNPNSNVALLYYSYLDKDRTLLVCNPIPKGRHRLSLLGTLNSLSPWKTLIDLQYKEGEYSYPAIVSTPKGIIHITYTYDRKTIAFESLFPKKLF